MGMQRMCWTGANFSSFCHWMTDHFSGVADGDGYFARSEGEGSLGIEHPHTGRTRLPTRQHHVPLEFLHEYVTGFLLPIALV